MSNGAQKRIRRSREKILSAAEDVFLRHGFLGANMDAVAELAGVSKQTVYSHCKSKETLFLQVVERMTGGAAQDIGEDREDSFDSTPAERFFLAAATEQLHVVMTPRLMRLRRMVIGEVERFPEIGRSLHENGAGRSIARFARAIEHYRRTGEIECVDPLSAATYFNWLVMGWPTNSAMFLGDAGIPSTSELNAHARECVRIFLAAYGDTAQP